MDRTNAKILDFELDFTKRRFIESYFINQIPDTMNDKQNGKFPSIYLATLLQTQWRNIIVFHAPPIGHFFRFHFVVIFALTYDSFRDVIFASIVRLFLTLHSNPDEDR